MRVSEASWLESSTNTELDVINFIAAESKPCAVFYAQGGLLNSAYGSKLDFLNLLRSLFEENGYETLLVDGIDLPGPLVGTEDTVHIWMIERPPIAVTTPNIFYCFPSYLFGFWYFDTRGIRNNSSIGQKYFRPQKMSGQWARKVFSRLKTEFVVPKRTKFDQPPEGQFDIPEHCIAVATQTFAKPTYYEAYIPYPELIAEVIKIRGNRPVVIKPHPLIGLSDADYLRRLHDPNNGVFVEAVNLHELLAKSDLVITRCSAVAIEAMLHKVPAIVTAQVDFCHCVTKVKNIEELEAAVSYIVGRHVPFEKYVTWFFTQQLFQPRNKEQSKAKILDLLKAQGIALGPKIAD